jgi:hypothetical protein
MAAGVTVQRKRKRVYTESDKEYQRQWRLANPRKVEAYRATTYSRHHEKMNAGKRKRWEKRQEWIAEYKAIHPCGRCGFNDIRCLEFHHRDPTDKAFKIGTTYTSQKKLEDEVAKCNVLCANCHRIVEWEHRQEQNREIHE